ncbi:hypothetical protein GCM10011581_05270 [Saccharopolyspora subtropica]|uniref:Uncharacterized protein n=1 Tax=Saccharopolyspora thermophila TaxID=89367 RepID=A0A917N6Y7_9PSEU|nr:hypothetical protein GCM10011581_05270 [Saccharopolyspora subtropica]
MLPILLVLGVLGVVVAVLAVWPLLAARGERRTALRPATATVVESRPCGARSARDLVSVEIDGVVRQAPFDGCGHTRGQKLAVQVPADAGADLVVRPAGASDSELDDLAQRAYWVLLTLAAVAGGCYGVMLHRRA